MRSRTGAYLVIGGALGCLGTVLFARVGTASPSGDPHLVTFSGVLEENGQLVNGKRDASLQFFATAAAADSLCTPAAKSVDVVGGVFSVEAPPACVEALRGQRSAWYQLTVGTTPLPITRVPSTLFALRTEESPAGARLRPTGWVGSDGTRQVTGFEFFDAKLQKKCSLYVFSAKTGFCVPEGQSLAFNEVSPYKEQTLVSWATQGAWSSGLGCPAGSPKCEITVHNSIDCSGPALNYSAHWLSIIWTAGALIFDQEKLFDATVVFKSSTVSARVDFGLGIQCHPWGYGDLTGVKKGNQATPDWVAFSPATL